MIVFGGSWICRLGCFKGRLSPAPFKMIGLFLGCVDRSPLTIDCLTAAWAAGVGNHIEWLPLYKRGNENWVGLHHQPHYLVTGTLSAAVCCGSPMCVVCVISRGLMRLIMWFRGIWVVRTKRRIFVRSIRLVMPVSLLLRVMLAAVSWRLAGNVHNRSIRGV